MCWTFERMIGMLFGLLEWFRQCNNNDYLLRTHGCYRGRLIIPIRGGRGKDDLFYIFHPHRTSSVSFLLNYSQSCIVYMFLPLLLWGGKITQRLLLISSPLPPVHTTSSKNLKLRGENHLFLYHLILFLC